MTVEVLRIRDNRKVYDRNVSVVRDSGAETQCSCGCNEKIFLIFLEDATPLWKLNFTHDGEINILPSIWRNVGCKSYFFIRNGRIDWVI